ncbi:phage terminase large subunit family protein [Gracilibacillus oryzae]|uniref:Phage terminase large subunit family protein n=1 Tax=Gracilibacillus oryzae TaxID=1672701 RepID=A0A7C8GR72_9BACI|nr:phage terminase large subunit family protein [Gracilibacillus oryzae]KAB8126917.1 phage terminase large subunit family protein [Gracilibacillus oryzae]
MPKRKKYEWPSFIVNTLRHLRPPEKLLVSEWAEKHRYLDSKTSAMPGPWNNGITPYLNDIMDEFNNPDTEEIVFVKPTQVGGSEALNNMVGYVVMQDPSPVMIVYPTDDLAEFISENRVQPMFNLSPGLRDKFNKRQSSRKDLQCDGMFISLDGANSPSGLSSKAIRYLFLDEVDKYPGASKKEADPIKLARERTKTFTTNKKIFMTSTPTLKSGHIWQAKEKADIVKHYKVPCPHCGDYIELKFQQIKWPKKDGMSYADRAEFANYVCQECGCIITDQHKPQMLRYGKWEVVEQRTQFPRKVAYWMNTLYSPFVRFGEIAKEFLASKDDPEQHQNFVNSWLAEPWEDTKLKTNADLVLERQSDYEEFEVPDWAVMLTGGVDVQETSLYWTIRAWGPYLTSQNIAHGQVLSFQEIEKVMNAEYQKRNGETLMVNLCGLDSGDQTDAVYEFCSINSEWAIPVKGVATSYAHFKISTINRATSSAHGTRLLLVDGGKYKDMIASRMRKPNGQGSWMVYKDCDREYAEQVTAEHKVNSKTSGGRTTQVWIPKTSHADNHYLDTEVYAMAAADVLHVRNIHLMQEEEETSNEPAVQSNEQAMQFNNSWLKNNNWL